MHLDHALLLHEPLPRQCDVLVSKQAGLPISTKSSNIAILSMIKCIHQSSKHPCINKIILSLSSMQLPASVHTSVLTRSNSVSSILLARSIWQVQSNRDYHNSTQRVRSVPWRLLTFAWWRGNHWLRLAKRGPRVPLHCTQVRRT